MASLRLVVVLILAACLQTTLLLSGCSVCLAQNQPDVEGASNRAAFLLNPDQWTSKVEKRLLGDWCDTTLEHTVASLASAKDELKTCRGIVIHLQDEAEQQLKNHRRQEKEFKDVQDEANLGYLRASAELHGDKKKAEADLAACQVLKSGSVTRQECNFEIQAGCAPWRRRSRELEAEVQDISQQCGTGGLSPNQSVSTEQSDALRIKIDALETSLGQCRLDKAVDAAAPGEQEEVIISDLEKKVSKLEMERKYLFGGLLLSLTVFVSIAAACKPYVAGKYEPQGTLSDVRYGRISPIDRNVLPQDFCASEDACEKLCSFELEQFSNVTPILTFARSSEHSGSEFVFLLVPLNASSSRKFTLFGGGGDYSRTVEVARDLVARDSLDTRLVIVLYEHGGRAFPIQTLRNLNMSADVLAYESLPKDSDSDFPLEDDLVVLWYDERAGLKVTDSGGESQLADLIRAQAWAQHLAKRAQDILTRSDRAVASYLEKSGQGRSTRAP